eukprot:TRINITY_DN2945_c2_g2_i1.p1 TRINITY_DN2945_c2_g2~~TRINITY_DN2945_c2_g2_i1.p1  ORF type:complete len:417 (+),score=71.93 TRINITY_DN2945_c2_g2_i1:102-1352(+)
MLRWALVVVLLVLHLFGCCGFQATYLGVDGSSSALTAVAAGGAVEHRKKHYGSSSHLVDLIKETRRARKEARRERRAAKHNKKADDGGPLSAAQSEEVELNAKNGKPMLPHSSGNGNVALEDGDMDEDVIIDRDVLALLMSMSVLEVMRGVMMKSADGGRNRPLVLAVLACSFVITLLEVTFFAGSMQLCVGWALYTTFETNVTILMGYVLWQEPVLMVHVLGQALSVCGCILLQWGMVADYFGLSSVYFWPELIAGFALTIAATVMVLHLKVHEAIGNIYKDKPVLFETSGTLEDKLAATRRKQDYQKYFALFCLVILDVASVILVDACDGFRYAHLTALTFICDILLNFAGIQYLSFVRLSSGWGLYSALTYSGVVLWGLLVMKESADFPARCGLLLCGLGACILIGSDTDDDD